MERLVTISDLEKYPKLIKQGVSINTHYDFDLLESTPTKSTPLEKEEHILEKITPPKKRKAVKTNQVITPKKHKAKSK